ncbi:MAG: ABC transporter ATP-binding protein [Candidatus Omnitrophota bacterium]
MAFQIKNLTCGYGSKAVLKNVNLGVKDREIFGIIGPNGCGKTTLLKAMTRVLRPETGEILFNGKCVWSMGFKELARKIAVVSQSAETAFISVEEFVLLGRIPFYKRFQFLETKKDLRLAEESMALTGVLGFRDRLMSEISGGERQLVFIARALAQEPELLLLDEPTTHLDITHQVKVLDLIRKLNREVGITVAMVLHDLNLAGEYCHRLALIKDGSVHRIGHPEEVLNYRDIEDVYKTVVVVRKNPISSRPYVLVVPEDSRKESL